MSTQQERIFDQWLVHLDLVQLLELRRAVIRAIHDREAALHRTNPIALHTDRKLEESR